MISFCVLSFILPSFSFVFYSFSSLFYSFLPFLPFFLSFFSFSFIFFFINTITLIVSLYCFTIWEREKLKLIIPSQPSSRSLMPWKYQGVASGVPQGVPQGVFSGVAAVNASALLFHDSGKYMWLSCRNSGWRRGALCWFRGTLAASG